MSVIHLIDSLSAGGAERVAVNMVNSLNDRGVAAYLCATRREGLLKNSIADQSRYVFLDRKSTFDRAALQKLISFIKQNNISIIHAHSSSFFVGVLAKFFCRSVKLVWHDHYGLSNQIAERKSLVLQVASLFFDAVISVNNSLKQWAERKLFVNNAKIFFLPNYADLKTETMSAWRESRLEHHTVVCLGNLRPQKDHRTLLMAFKKVQEKYANASLYLVGNDLNDSYSQSLKQLVQQLNLKNVFFTGGQTDVIPFLEKASIGVLSSLSEGLPVALLEYGQAALPVICTDVGECKKVLDDGRAGWVVPSQNTDTLANAMIEAFADVERAKNFSQRFNKHVATYYSSSNVMNQLTKIYQSLN